MRMGHTDHCQDIWRSPLNCRAPSRELPHHWLQQRLCQIWSTTREDCSARSCKPAITSAWQALASDTDCSRDHRDAPSTSVGQNSPVSSPSCSTVEHHLLAVINLKTWRIRSYRPYVGSVLTQIHRQARVARCRTRQRWALQRWS